MMSTSLIQGLEIVAIVSLMTIVLSPFLCWILPIRTGAHNRDLSGRQTA